MARQESQNRRRRPASNALTARNRDASQRRGKQAAQSRLGGGAEGIRTPDLCSAIAALSHLSYSPDRRVGPHGGGPATGGLWRAGPRLSIGAHRAPATGWTGLFAELRLVRGG